MSDKESVELEYILKPQIKNNQSPPVVSTNAVNTSNVATTNTANNNNITGKYLPPPTDEELNSFYDETLARQQQDKWDKLKQLSKKNPFVPLGCLITAGVLVNGVLAMKRGDRAKSQRMMRYRIGAQGITILAVIGGTLVTQYFVG